MAALTFVPLTPAELPEFVAGTFVPDAGVITLPREDEAAEHEALRAAAAQADIVAVTEGEPRFPNTISLFTTDATGELLWYSPTEWQSVLRVGS
ncbi:MAG: hypothetical protein LBR20_00325 [Propionibacteriaceae bacterium]|jgi:hypothetical protein|nr:hypothetical protein [Propionibacteriaceae bacterium]